MRIVLPGLQPGSNYALELQAKGYDARVSKWSPRFLIQTISNEDIPNTPTNVTWIAVGDAFHGEWDAVLTDTNGDEIQVNRYEIEMTGQPGSVIAFASVPQITGSPKVTFDLPYEENVAKFIVAKANIAIRVRAVGANGVKSGWTESVTAGNEAPPAPTGFAGSVNFEYIDLSWNSVVASDLVGYRVYLSTNGAGGTYNQIYQGNALNYSFPSAMYTTDHYFYVVAYDIFGLESVPSNTIGPLRPNSSFTVDLTAPDVPTSLSMTINNGANGEPGTANITWAVPSPSSDLAGFTIRWRKVGGTDWQATSVDKDSRAVQVLLDTAYVNYESQIRAYDWSANYSVWSASAIGVAPANAAPSTPASPSASSSTMRIQVTPTGNKAAGGPIEADVVTYEVYASTTSGFTTYDATTMLGRIDTGPAMTAAFPIPASGGATATQTWYVKIIAVDSAGLKSPASAQTTATPGLIDAANIVDASITNAKIQSLNVDKLEAGSGLATSFTVKSTLTIGDAATNGFIQSYDWSSGVSGYRLSKNSLEINNGSIKAGALQIQTGANIFPAEYASFELIANGATIPSSAASTAVVSTTFAWTGSQSLKISDASGWFSLESYSFPVQPSETYIVSFYALSPTGSAGTPTLQPVFRLAGYGDVAGAAVATLTKDSTWRRYSTTITVPAGVSGTNAVYFNITGGAGSVVYVDGIQVESKIGATNSPSVWNPPGLTRVDGGMIKTGQIISTSTTVVNGSTIPLWSIPLNGSATFANLTVRGLSIVGVSGDGGNSGIQSANYNGSVGWKIDAAGNAYFASGTFKGDITGASGTFSGNITGSAATITGTITGNTVQTSGSSTYVTRMTSTTFQIIGSDPANPLLDFNTGANTLTIGANAVFKGSLSGVTGTFSGSLSGATGTFAGTVSVGSTSVVTISNSGGHGIIQFSGGTITSSAGYINMYASSGGFINIKTSRVEIGGGMSVSGGSIFYGGVEIQGTANTQLVNSKLVGNSGITITSGGIDITGTSDFRTAIQMNGNNLNGCGKITVTSGGMEVGGVVDFNSLATGGSQQNGLGIRYVQVDANGLLSSSANAPSSIKVKHDIQDLSNINYRDVLALTPKTFRYNTVPDEVRSGFIAEEAEELGLDTWVSYEDSDNPEQPTGFDYIGFISALQLVNREQQKQIDELRALVGLDKSPEDS